MTDNQIIDRILYKMVPTASHGYLNLWKDVSNCTLEDLRWAVKPGSRAEKVLTKLVKRRLVTVRYDSANTNISYALIELADRALKLRENETWFNNVQQGMLTPKPEKWITIRSVSVWAVGVATGIFITVAGMIIYDKIKPTFNNESDGARKSMRSDPGDASDRIKMTKDSVDNL